MSIKCHTQKDAQMVAINILCQLILASFCFRMCVLTLTHILPYLPDYTKNAESELSGSKRTLLGLRSWAHPPLSLIREGICVSPECRLFQRTEAGRGRETRGRQDGHPGTKNDMNLLTLFWKLDLQITIV